MDLTEISLVVLICTSIICLIVLTVFVVKFLYSASKLVNNINKACDTVNNELEPVVKDLKETVSGITSIVKATDNRIKTVNCALNGVIGATGVLGGKLKEVLSGVVEGFRAGINLFKK